MPRLLLWTDLITSPTSSTFMSLKLALIAAFGLCSSVFAYDLPDPPISIRLYRLGSALKSMALAKPGTKVVTAILRTGLEAFTLRWIPPGDQVIRANQPLSAEAVVGIAVAGLQGKLPGDLRPDPIKLIGVSKYRLLEESGSWIWVAEFQIKESGPLGGNGFASTLLVPVSEGGALLVEVEAKK